MRNSKMQKPLTYIMLSLLLLSLLAGCGTEPVLPSPVPGELTKVTISLGYIQNVQFTPYYVALNRGYYRDEGLDVTFKHGIVPDLIKLLGAGDEGVNFAAVSGDELITARMQGVPVVYVMTWYRQYPVAVASIKGKGPALTSPADLRGRTVGIPGPYGATYTGLLALMKAGGLAQSDINMKSIGFTQVESLATGQVDAAMVYAANEPTQLRSQGMSVNTLLVSDHMKLAANGLATNDKTIKENPELIRKVVRATLKGIKETIADATTAFEDAAKQVPEITGNNRELQLQVLQETVKLMQPKAGDPAASHPLGWTDASVWSATQDFLLEASIIPRKGNIQEMFTNDFVPK
jgi:NitT/TauT family transport system substrate-binding protein